MKRQDEKEAYEAQVAANKKFIAEKKAHMTRDLKLLITDHLVFKLHMAFKKRDANSKSVKRSIYGNEHSVTYDQCFFGKVDCIVLDRKKGYNDLIRYIEQDLKGQYIECKIYMDDGTRKFPRLCRKYHKGSRVLEDDPALSEEDVKLLYFTTEKGLLVIHETKPEEPDFKALMAEALK